MLKKAEVGEQNCVAIVVDEAGVMLHIEGFGAAARYAEGVCEGEGVSSHVHPEDRAFSI